MKVRARIADNHAVDVTIQITMPLGQWQQLRNCISGNQDPQRGVKEAIDRAVARITAVIEEEADVAKEATV